MASAVTITVSFTATIDFISPDISSGPFAVGDSASGSFKINSSVLDENPLLTDGNYPGAVSNLVITFGDYAGTGGNPAPNEVHVYDGSVPYGDAFDVFASVNGDPAAGFFPPFFQLNLLAVEDTIFSSDAIPYGLSLADFETANVVLRFDLYTDNQVVAHLTSLSYVPEPSTGPLVIAGLLALAYRQRRRGRSSDGVQP